ncbi:MAG TPA: hypothetical protein VI796_05745 [Candidatus Thermoplasmatota archaeon]|nr:hypothetical protein [Candidatus Thermoplasmatota archaeon]
MASKANANEARFHLDSRGVTRLFIVLACGVILGASLITPWWTRGFNINWDEDQNPRPAEAPVEGLYVNYRPYATPGSAGGFSTDAGRETATAILGISLTLCALFVVAASVLRVAMRMGWVETNHDTPVRFAIGAFVVGLFAVLWGAFFLPLLGPNPGMLYGGESDQTVQDFGEEDFAFVESTRYANVGFFLGIVGAVGFPAFLWADAVRERNEAGTSTASRTGRASPSF